MKKIMIVCIGVLLLFMNSCGIGKGVPITIGDACSQLNNEKLVEIGGFLAPSHSIFCSGTSGRTECSLLLKETPDSSNEIRAYVEQGTSANTVEKPESDKNEGLRIRDNTGSVVNLPEKFLLTGEMRIGTESCSIKVLKIEKSQ